MRYPPTFPPICAWAARAPPLAPAPRLPSVSAGCPSPARLPPTPPTVSDEATRSAADRGARPSPLPCRDPHHQRNRGRPLCWPSPCGRPVFRGRDSRRRDPQRVGRSPGRPLARPSTRTRQGVGPFDGKVKSYKPTRRRRCRPLHESTSPPGGYRQPVRRCAERRAIDGACNRTPNSPSQPGTRRESGRPTATEGCRRALPRGGLAGNPVRCGLQPGSREGLLHGNGPAGCCWSARTGHTRHRISGLASSATGGLLCFLALHMAYWCDLRGARLKLRACSSSKLTLIWGACPLARSDSGRCGGGGGGSWVSFRVSWSPRLSRWSPNGGGRWPF